jgi:hypothetical protein
MSDALLRHAEALVAAAQSGDEQTFAPLVRGFRRVAEAAPPEECSKANDLLVAGIDRADLERGGMLAVAAGMLVERGADGEALAARVVNVVPALLDAGAIIAELLRAAAVPMDDPDAQAPPDAVVVGDGAVHRASLRALEKERPSAWRAWIALEPWCAAAVAALPCVEHERLQAKRHWRLERFSFGHPSMMDLRALCAALDESVVVLEPATRRGFRLRVGGITSTAQLAVLLSAALAPALDVKPPHRRIVAAFDGSGPAVLDAKETRIFAVWPWCAVTPAAELASPIPDLVRWLVSEGRASGYPFLGTTRVLVLGERAKTLIVPTHRDFPRLGASARVEEELGAGEVKALLERCGRESGEALRGV